MLVDARERLDEGVDVVIGALASHGQPETQALAEGFEVLPPRVLPLRGEPMEEFDLDAALRRRPGLILLDELAHANVQGSLHAKRWQDVWDLLDAGIHVSTALNVQNLESLTDVIAQITGLRIRETVPDTLFNRADQVELVDLPTEELLERLQMGKVYLPAADRHATERFFRKGNLLALRELALRKVAEHVDAHMRRYMNEQGITRTWAAGERLMACVTPHPDSGRLIRSTRRLADTIKAPWLVAYVETGRPGQSARDRAQLEEHLRTAERLGAETIVIQGDRSLADDLLALARARNVTRILVGKPKGVAWLGPLRPSLVTALVRKGGAIDVMVIARDRDLPPEAPVAPQPRERKGIAVLLPALHLLGSALALSLATLLALVMDARRFELADLIMVYVLAILGVAARFGRWAALTASVGSVLLLDWFFIDPRFRLGYSDPKHTGTFIVLLILGVVIGDLAERLRSQVRLARAREQRTLALLALASELAASDGSKASLEAALRRVASPLGLQVALHLQGPHGGLVEATEAAQWVFDHNEAAGPGTDNLAEGDALYLPLRGSRGPLGVLGAKPQIGRLALDADQRHLMAAFAQHTAGALERASLATRTASSEKQADREQMRSALLTSVARDLRRPIADLAAIADNLRREGDGLGPAERQGQLDRLMSEARGLQSRITNLVEVSRLESGALELHRTAVPAAALLEDALARLEPMTRGRDIRISLPPDLPLLPADPVLLEQAIVNILENALHFTPPGSPIEIRGWATDRSVTLCIADQGPGVPEGQEQRIFDRLVAFPTPFGSPGAGLGLALCKGVVEAHGGLIQASARPQGGTQVMVSLPLA